jgi:hypothetical protein
VHKNIGPFIAFNKDWFAKNQRVLLWLLNAPLIKVWFRWVLRIRPHDCPLTTPITDIEANNFSFGDRLIKRNGEWLLERTTDFRTHPKFGKRLYFAFRPLWWLIHFWDWALADRFIPKWSYGFSTLTVFPDAGSPGTTTVDGGVNRAAVNETFGTIRAGAGNQHDDVGGGMAVRLLASASTDQYENMERLIALFDTSSLTSSATISAATFSLYGFSSGNLLGGTQGIAIVASTPASNTALANSDFSQLGSTRFATDLAIGSMSTSGYNDFALNASGIANISKTGISKFGARITADIDNTAPTWGSAEQARANFRTADTSGTSQDPQLVVTYSTSTAYTKNLTETATVSDALSKGATKLLTQSTTITDALTKASTKLLTQAATITDALLKTPTKLLAETATIADSLVRTATRILTETATVADSLIKTATKLLTESPTITDTITNLRAKVQTLIEAFTGTDSVIKAPTKTLAETPAISALLVKAPSRNLTEAFTVSDVLQKLRTAFIVLIDTLTGADSINKAPTKVLTEVPTLADTVQKSSGRQLSETATVSDTITKAPSRPLTETLTITDRLSKTITRLLTEATTLMDAFLSTRLMTRVLTESVVITDYFARTLNKVLTETFSVVATLKKYLNGLVAMFTDKYTTRNTSYSDKNSSRGTTYSDKYTHLP